MWGKKDMESQRTQGRVDWGLHQVHRVPFPLHLGEIGGWMNGKWAVGATEITYNNGGSEGERGRAGREYSCRYVQVQGKLHSPPWTPFTFFGSGVCGEEEEEKLLVKATGAEELEQKR